MLEAGALFAGKVVLQTIIAESMKRIIEKQWRLQTDEGKKILEHFKIDDVRDKYASKIRSNVLTFRSLSQGGSNVSLEDVYYPLTVTVKDSKDTILVTDETIIKHKGIVVISGSAGQGKTTVLRKLFLEEIKGGYRFPFFITLRNISFKNGITLIEIFMDHLLEFGIKAREEDASLLLQSNNIVLFFDGFDEIANKERAHALDVLKSAWFRYTCPVIVTTRPNTELYREGGFKNLIVNPLASDDITGIIHNSVRDEETRKALINLLKKKKFILEALIYPILVDIFIVSFYSMKDTPATIGDFYNGLFRSLLFSHDQQKNFSRERKSGLDVKELQDCFNLFSLISFLEGKQDFNENELEKLFIETCETLDRKEGYKNIKEDIVDGTNLISLNGYRFYSYIHRSIQEYHAALYISGLDDVEINYKKLSCLSDYSQMTFLNFLESIDDKKFYLNYVRPYLKSIGLSDIINQSIYDLSHILKESLIGSSITISISEDTLNILSYSVSLGRGIKFLRRLNRVSFLNSLLNGSLNNDSLDAIDLIDLNGFDDLFKKDDFKLLASHKETNEVKLSDKIDAEPMHTITYDFNMLDVFNYKADLFRLEFYYEEFVSIHSSLILFYKNKILPKINAKNPNEKIRSLIKRNNSGE
ncbi:NACHT domain-containing protein [Serratia sp. JSRIV001]|uniref:NACHT domain-containing protein n=1 Tax=unclassified Serratia (in: enterobacteria) TaxID=2647522 RepID=UPI001CBB4054|nr:MULTISPECIES: NACHT domain-containing protein [unclassified Serratia (in: enterobacteria)]UAN43808.1 NACHT domain-containing protein [Serratia sp. JSRIV001]UAN60995.1 NACHT domain-containing protein [Serratia sp. JSRIV006]